MSYVIQFARYICVMNVYIVIYKFPVYKCMYAFSYCTCCRSWPDNVHALQACSKLMEVARKHGIKSFVGEQNLQEVYSYLRLNLCSASHVVRLLTLKILSCFDQPERSSSDNKVQYSQETLCMHAFMGSYDLYGVSTAITC